MSGRPRIAVVHNLPPGGAWRRLAQQVPYLDGAVVELTLGTGTPITDDAIVVPYAPRADAAPGPLRPPLRHTDLLELLAAWRALRKRLVAAAPDVVYANPCRYLQGPAGLIGVTTPSLYFCDEPRRADYDEAARATTRRRTRALYAPMRRLQRTTDRRAVAAATRLVTNSAFTSGTIRRAYGRDAEPIPLGVPDRFRPTGEPMAGHLLSVGMLIPGKGHELVIEAAARARVRRPLVVVTPRKDPEGERRLHAAAAQHGVALEIRTAISDDALRSTYATAFATLYLARNEPLGLAALEAQACGAPVIVSAEGGLPETIVADETGFAVARDPAAAAVALDRLEEPGRRDAMGAAAIDHGAEMTWERSGRLVAAQLRALLDG